MKILVAHPGRQHSYRVATALKEAGMLYRYATTVYNKQSSILMRILKLFLTRDNYTRASRRVCPLLCDEDVIQFCEFEALIHLALIRLDFTHRLSKAYGRFVSRKFQYKLASYIIKEHVDVVISYDTNSTELFSILKDKAPNVIRIMDNAHPNRCFLFHDYRENWSCCAEFSKTLKACGYLTDKEIAETYALEANLAHYHIVASTYSEKALNFVGISSDGIFKIPYGVDKNKFVDSQKSYELGKLNILFLGDINQRKGIRQVLEAAKTIASDKVVFNIVGSGADHCAELYAPYKQYVNFMGFVSYEELQSQMRTNQLFLFPTMGEGFGLVLLEAMAAGMPVITTSSCGGGDIVVDGVNGFIVPVGDVDKILSVIEYCLENPSVLHKMSQNSVETAKKYTWENYNLAIQNCITSLLTK